MSSGTRSATDINYKAYKLLILLKNLSGVKPFNRQIVNEKILESFKNEEFVPRNITAATNLLSPFTSWFLNTTPATKLKEKLTFIQKIYSSYYENIKTLDVAYSRDIRNIIKDKYGHNSEQHKLSLEITAIKKSDKIDMMSVQKEKVFDKNANQDIVKSNDIFKMIRENMDHPDPFFRMIALFICSGSRPIELFEKSSFEAIDDEWVKQVGLAKKKKGNANDFYVIKPIVYITSHDFIDELSTVRTEVARLFKPKGMLESEFDDLDERASDGDVNAFIKINSFLLGKRGQLKQSISARLNNAAHKIFQNNEDFSAYFCRKLYAILSYEQVGQYPNIHGERMNISAWTSSVLGHEENSLLTSHNYTHVSLDTGDDVSNKNLAINQQILLSKIKYLEEIVDSKKVITVPDPQPKISIKKQKKYEQIRKFYEEHKDEKLNQTALETLLKGQVPRDIVREWYQNNVY